MLGNARVLTAEAAADSRRRAVVVRDGLLLALGVFELLYGPQAEFAVALRDPADTQLVREVVAALIVAAHACGVNTLRATLDPSQLPLAISIPDSRLTETVLLVDAGRRASVTTTDGEAQVAPMPDRSIRSTI